MGAIRVRNQKLQRFCQGVAVLKNVAAPRGWTPHPAVGHQRLAQEKTHAATRVYLPHPAADYRTCGL